MKSLFIFIVLVNSFLAFSQRDIKAETIPTNKPMELVGNKILVDGVEYSHYDVNQHFLNTNAQAYDNFNAYKTKSSIGGFLLGLGGGLMVGDLVRGLVSDVEYPGGMTYAGAGAAAISIPVLAGRKKKLKQSIESYNEKIDVKSSNATSINVVCNQNGIGLNFRF